MLFSFNYLKSKFFVKLYGTVIIQLNMSTKVKIIILKYNSLMFILNILTNTHYQMYHHFQHSLKHVQPSYFLYQVFYTVTSTLKSLYKVDDQLLGLFDNTQLQPLYHYSTLNIYTEIYKHTA